MKITKTGHQMFLVIGVENALNDDIGVENTGSWSLTLPEFFDVVGVFHDREDAQACADEKNLDAGFEYDKNLSGAREYYVETLDVLTRKK